MDKQQHQQELISNLKAITSASYAILDMILAEEEISYHQVEATTNYIQVCAQRVQQLMKKYEHERNN